MACIWIFLVYTGAVHEIVHYTPRSFTVEEKRNLLSPRFDPDEIGVVHQDIDSIGDQFFNELTKREIGRQYCMRNGCSHFMSMDCDEFYLTHQLEYAKRVMEERGYEGALCKMRYLYR
jgi:hypothetical protein